MLRPEGWRGGAGTEEDEEGRAAAGLREQVNCAGSGGRALEGWRGDRVGSRYRAWRATLDACKRPESC